ncbi:hypothetical protein CGCSCA5_v004531 [Colletotrichum siamense]|nr:hypothetical protein CGCSCA5_v004531 [Colletotrichum siamense]KAI8157899.1 hypothetical protein K4K50_004438 [Colletotrichum sp. SAR 10_71]KAI8171385.1 hypothetical protein KHU50_005503 [Colletotrichum sp. SAR 10_65]KAI8195043.1 hypothetical protein K4K49_008791 [Colletotrichum sp. SAR 10_70]
MEASPRRSSSTPLYTAPLPSVHLSPVHAKANHPMKLRHENGTMIRKIQGWAKLSISSAGPRSSGSSSFSRLMQGIKVPIRMNGDRDQSPRRLAAAEETLQRSQRSQEDEAPPLQPVDVERVRTIEKVAAAKIYLESY